MTVQFLLRKAPSLPCQHPHRTPAPGWAVTTQAPGCYVRASGRVPAHQHTPTSTTHATFLPRLGIRFKDSDSRSQWLDSILTFVFATPLALREKTFLLHNSQRNQPGKNTGSIQWYPCPEATVGCARSGFQACFWPFQAACSAETMRQADGSVTPTQSFFNCSYLRPPFHLKMMCVCVRARASTHVCTHTCMRAHALMCRHAMYACTCSHFV